jgi:hypothetical protein
MRDSCLLSTLREQSLTPPVCMPGLCQSSAVLLLVRGISAIVVASAVREVMHGLDT